MCGVCENCLILLPFGMNCSLKHFKKVRMKEILNFFFGFVLFEMKEKHIRKKLMKIINFKNDKRETFFKIKSKYYN